MVSPLLANVYLHYVFDLWVEAWRKKVARGDVIVVRYADDLVVGFEHRTDAERFLQEFRERLAKFGLELHPDKTRLIEFGRFRRTRPGTAWRGKTGELHVPGVHALLWERQQRTFHRLAQDGEEADGGEAAVPSKQSFARRMHEPLRQSGEWLQNVVRGLLPIPCCSRQQRDAWPVPESALLAVAASFLYVAVNGKLAWDRLSLGLQPLDSLPRVLASLSQRSLRRHSSEVRAVCVDAHVRICAGGDQRWSSLPRPVIL